MKKVRDTWWNRIFRPRKLKKYLEYHRHCQFIVSWYSSLFQDLRDAKSLLDLMNIHKFAWSIGYRNKNLSPCELGMFRTKDISTMTSDEVYLGGNKTGLNTENIVFWEIHRNDTWGCNGYNIPENRRLYDTVMAQYRSLLISNFLEIKSSAEAEQL